MKYEAKYEYNYDTIQNHSIIIIIKFFIKAKYVNLYATICCLFLTWVFAVFRTALAEAELEYDPQYKSKEVYVSFPIDKSPQVAMDFLNGYVTLLHQYTLL